MQKEPLDIIRNANVESILLRPIAVKCNFAATCSIAGRTGFTALFFEFCKADAVTCSCCRILSQPIVSATARTGGASTAALLAGPRDGAGTCESSGCRLSAGGCKLKPRHTPTFGISPNRRFVMLLKSLSFLPGAVGRRINFSLIPVSYTHLTLPTKA